MSLDDAAEELASTLGVDKTEVKEDLEKLVSYSVPMDEAKQSLRRKYGDSSGGGGDSGTPPKTEIAQITPDTGNVSVSARVLTVGKRSIRYEGENQIIFEGELADETGRISYTAWNDFSLSPGDTITAGNAGVREWNGNPELNLGGSTTVTLESESLSVPYEVGGDRDLIDLEPGDRGRTLAVTVLDVERRTIDGRDGETEILSGEIGDETTRLPFTDWAPHPEITEGASVRLEDVYVDEFRGVPSVNVTEFSTVDPIDDVSVNESATEMTIGDAVESGGVY